MGATRLSNLRALALGRTPGRHRPKETSIPAPASPSRFENLAEAAAWYADWRTAALALWTDAGVDPATGGFREALTWTGEAVDPHRRARVQARQAFVFASAGRRALAEAGFAVFVRHAERPDGLFARVLDLAGGQVDPVARLYEHAFILLAMASLGQAEAANALRGRLTAFRHAAGGFRESDEHPFQANAQMHLLEAALAWEARSDEAGWAALADEVAQLALRRFIDSATGALREFYDADWRALDGAAGLIEPGHQFEWAWLLAQWGASRGDEAAQAAARRLFAVGRRGVDPATGRVVNALWDDLTVRDAAQRLWPQTEHLKAALALGETEAALQAANALAGFLDTPVRGAWCERMDAAGRAIVAPSPATSLYHLDLAIRELLRFTGNPC